MTSDNQIQIYLGIQFSTLNVINEAYRRLQLSLLTDGGGRLVVT